MAIFNVEKYIERSFKSILNQTMDLDDIEVIMVDDCSTDNTKNIIKEYSEKYPNFKAVFHEKNSGGCAMPRNSGLKVASGKYVMFLDPDDEYAPDMCETLYNKIEEKQVDLVKCNHELRFNNISRLNYQFDKNIDEIELECETSVPSNSVSVCNAIHNREFLIKNNITFPNYKNGEDIVFSTNEFLNTAKIIYINNYHGYKYYTNPEISHSMKPTTDNLDAILAGYCTTKELIEKNNRQDIFIPFFSEVTFSFFLRLINYDGDKKYYLKKFYAFEKSMNVELNMKFLWLNILNKLILKKQFTLAAIYLDFMHIIRNSPLIKIYRKSL